MKKLTLAFLIVALAFQAYAAKGGGGGGHGCSDLPISWTFDNSTTTGIPSAITGDGKRPDYREGVDGVFNSVIHRVSNRGGCEGSRDATLGLSRSKRTVSVRFSGIDGTDTVQGQFPAFNGNTLAIQPFMIIQNIMGYGYPVGATYYTKGGVLFKAPGDRETGYQMLFLPFNWQCPGVFGFDCVDSITGDQITANQNDPVPTAWVRINYIPASGTTPDQWIAEGEFSDPEIQRGTLLVDNVHSGQFSMPFRIRITALAPLQ